MTDPIVFAPKAWLDLVVPPKPPAAAPWERVDPRPVVGAPATGPSLLEGGRMPLLERARLYLREVDPAVQGSGGHNALLWAARCLVVGFELDEATALQLLWSEYNPRCSPPWRQDDAAEAKDFERKVAQAKATPASKKPGWLLDEFGLRGSASAERARALGETSAAALLASAQKRAEIAPETLVAPELKPVAPPEPGERQPFPIEHLPEAVRDYCLTLSESQGVDTSFVALPALAVAGAAMGNAWRFAVKPTWKVAPILWVCLVAAPGRNKTGPLKAVMEALRKRVPIEAITNPILNPQGAMVVSDATLEAVLALMSESHRGLLSFNDEFAAWIEGFGKGRKGGARGDEAAWLQFWNGEAYNLNRKTNNERVYIPAASASVLGGIQPKVLTKLFDPGRFDSGFVSRFLIACPPHRTKFWTDHDVNPAAADRWQEAVTWLRCTPFVGQDTSDGTMLPRVVSIGEGPQKTAYADFYDWTEAEMQDGALDDGACAFMSKAQTQAARFALIHHGLRLAFGERANLDAPIAVESTKAGVAWARWCLFEQFRAYGYGVKLKAKDDREALLDAIRTKCPTKSATSAQVGRLNSRRWQPRQKAVAAMAGLVEAGYARWADETRDKIILNEEVKP